MVLKPCEIKSNLTISMTIDIVIKRSHLPNKKYDAIIDGKKTIPFGQKNASDFTNIRMKNESKDIQIDIGKMRTGMISKALASTVDR